MVVNFIDFGINKVYRKKIDDYGLFNGIFKYVYLYDVIF